MDELTDDQKFANYCRLVSTIHFIEEEHRITEDWMEEQKDYIKTIRNVFAEGFQNLNPEIKTKEFRTTANESETILNNLMMSIQYDKTFKVSQYHSFLVRILKMLKIVCQHHTEGDELCEFMQKMSLR
jgi:hypothetical protein